MFDYDRVVREVVEKIACEGSLKQDSNVALLDERMRNPESLDLATVISEETNGMQMRLQQLDAKLQLEDAARGDQLVAMLARVQHVESCLSEFSAEHMQIAMQARDEQQAAMQARVEHLANVLSDLETLDMAQLERSRVEIESTWKCNVDRLNTIELQLVECRTKSGGVPVDDGARVLAVATAKRLDTLEAATHELASKATHELAAATAERLDALVVAQKKLGPRISSLGNWCSHEFDRATALRFRMLQQVGLELTEAEAEERADLAARLRLAQVAEEAEAEQSTPAQQVQVKEPHSKTSTAQQDQHSKGDAAQHSKTSTGQVEEPHTIANKAQQHSCRRKRRPNRDSAIDAS